MPARLTPSRPAGSAGRGLPALLSGLLLLSACGGSDDTPEVAAAAPPTSAEVVVTTEPAPSTTDMPEPVATTEAPSSSTTMAPTSTMKATTTTAKATTTTFAPIETSLPPTTTTLFVEPPPPEQPIAPPADSYAQEPVIEVGTIVIPKLGVDMTMYEGIRLTTLDYGPGHWPGTAMPGQVGNVVVGGHRTSSHRVFRNVDQLVPGDEITFRDAAGEHTYAVNRVEVVEPTAVWIVDPTPTATATLFACHPPGSTAQRIVVFADLIES